LDEPLQVVAQILDEMEVAYDLDTVITIAAKTAREIYITTDHRHPLTVVIMQGRDEWEVDLHDPNSIDEIRSVIGIMI
jgi:hypothetical protein